MKKSTHPLLQLLVMLAIALFMLLATSIAAIPFAANTTRTSIMILQSVTQLLTFVIPPVVMVLIYYRGEMCSFLKLDFHGRKWLLGLAGVVVMLLFIPANDWLTEWNKGWDLGRVGEVLRSLQDATEGIVKDIVNADTVGGLVGNLIVVALLPAVCEEIFFRAGFQNLLQRWLKNPHVAVWLTAVIFSLAHGEVFSFMPRLVLGAILGYLYVYSGSILTNMLAHFINNAIVVVLYWLVARGMLDIDPEASLGIGWVLTACCTVAAVALFIVTFVFNGRKKVLKG